MATGDEWKGEDDNESLSWSFWGTPMTAEQRAKHERAWAEKKAKGDMLGALLQTLDLARLCPKCGHEKVKAIYCAGSETYSGSDCYPHTGCHEHMHRRCKRCSYQWYEKPLGEEYT